MARISLTIDKNYCANWGLFEGVREMIQNAKDADEDGYEMMIHHFPRTNRLEIINRGVYVDPAKLLILGKSDKRPGEKRGQFGEGFVLGCIALVRQGFEVRFQNGELSWGITFENPDDNHPLAGNELLTFKSRKVTPERDFRIEIEGITKEIWSELRKFFLFIDVPKEDETISVSRGKVLLGAHHKGAVFARGIFVRKFDDLSCGYDLNHLELDRDRRFVDEWSLHWQLGELWKEACEASPDAANNRVYDFVKASAPEAKCFKYTADERLVNGVKKKFFDEYGEDAIPVMSVAEAREIEEMGGKPAIVTDGLKELLVRGGLSLENKRAELESQVVQRHEPSDLELAEMAVLARLLRTVDVSVVTFRGDKPSCRVIDDGAVVGVDRRMLSRDYRALLKQAVLTEARRSGKDALDIVLDCVSRYHV